MNISTIIGLITGLLVIFAGISMSTATPSELIHPAGMIFVFGGTIATLFLSFPLRDVMRAFRNMFIVFRNDDVDFEHDIESIFTMARLSSRGEVRELEREIERITNPFLRSGIQLLVDNTPAEDVIRLLEWRIARFKRQEAAEAYLFRVMGNYAPAFGMLGTVLGLVNLLTAMGANNLQQIGPSLAIAMLTTFYGLLLANMVFKPIAVKLERRTEKRLATLSMVMEGIEMISEHRSPSLIRETLHSFMMTHPDELRDGGGTSALKDAKSSVESP